MEKEIFLGEQKIVYFEKGEGDPFLIIHGWGGDVGPSDNLKFLDALSQKGFKVFLPCLPGFDKSSLPNPKTGKDEITESVLRFIEKMDLDNFFLYGHSLGAIIAMKVAKLSQRKVKGIILCGTPSPFLIKNIIRFGSLLIPGLLSLARLVVIIFPPVWFFGHFKKWIKMQFNFYIRERWAMYRVWQKIISMNFNETFFEIDRVKIPALLVGGIEDNFVVKNGLKFFVTMPNSYSKIISGVGHSIQLEAPEKLVDAILDFREKIS